MTTISPTIYQAIAIKHGLAFYAKTGMWINTAYTPKNMMAMVAKINGAKLKARDYAGGVAALEAYLQANIKDRVQ